MWKPDPSIIITAQQKAAQQKAAEAQSVLKEQYRAAIQAHIDVTARSRNYGDGKALAGYKDSTVPQWSAEAVAFIAWRDAVWLYSYAELDKVLSGEREQPTVEAFIGELPALEWPV